MADDKSKGGEPDRSRINMSEEYQVNYWTDKFGVSKEELQRAVEGVGPSAGAVEQEVRLTHMKD